MNPWHDVSLGDKFPDIIRAIIEIPKGSKNKYEIDKESGMIKVDRVLFSSMHYPANYGFIPKSYCGDNDPLDILVLGQEPVPPLTLMMAKPIGVMKMVDQGASDDKIIAVHANDPEYADFNSIYELPKHRLQELRRFFEDYTALENKTVVVKDFFDREEAIKVINESIELYKKTFK